jgi:hypothetical protein
VATAAVATATATPSDAIEPTAMPMPTTLPDDESEPGAASAGRFVLESVTTTEPEAKVTWLRATARPDRHMLVEAEIHAPSGTFYRIYLLRPSGDTYVIESREQVSSDSVN